MNYKRTNILHFAKSLRLTLRSARWINTNSVTDKINVCSQGLQHLLEKSSFQNLSLKHCYHISNSNSLPFVNYHSHLPKMNGVIKCPLLDSMKIFEDNRSRLNKKLDGHNGSVVFLEGGNPVNHYSTDVEYLFRQEPYFHWMFGVSEPGFFGAFCIGTCESILFMPRLPESYGVWMGKLLGPEEVKEKYSVSKVYYTDEIFEVLSSLKPKSLLTLYGMNTDSKLYCKEAQFDGISKFTVNNTALFPVISECRVIKSADEIKVLRHVAQVSSEAHKYVMLNIEPGMYEYQAEALFTHYCYFNAGCRHVAYTCICGSGENSGVLHYGHAGAPNDKKILDGDMCLFDMGASYMGYSADITMSFPVSGKFTPIQTVVYNAVLKARNEVLKSMKPGVSWVDMHVLAMRTILIDLKSFGALKGDVDSMIKAGLGGVFMPHGLGHLLGIDVHDVGGYLEGTPERPKESWLCSLRTARSLEAGMVITVEPGCYFIDCVLDKALQNNDQKDYLIKEVLDEFRGFGGVRIEDDVLVTDTGVEVFGKLPRTVAEIEEFMNLRKK